MRSRSPRPARPPLRPATPAERWAIVRTALGATALLVGLVIGGNIGWFYLHSAISGGALVRQEHGAIESAQRAAAQHRALPAASCGPLSDTSAAPQGLLQASTIGMTAPVMGGDSDTALGEAVGHVPGSAWPGQPGTSVLVAHDITYFSNISSLRVGSTVEFATACDTYTYRVTGHQVIDAGTPIYSNPDQPVLVLETCYPTDALYYTDQRYLVTASFVATSPAGTPTPAITAPATPAVPAAPALIAEGLSLATNDAPLGVLHIDGTPAASWRQSMAPYDDEAAALTEYFGAIRAAEQDQLAWWSALAPQVPLSAAQVLMGATITGYDHALDVTLITEGTSLVGASLSADVAVTSGGRTAGYAVHMVAADLASTLTVIGWTMAPA